MTWSITLAFASALFAGTLAAVAVLRNRSSVALWAFVAGMVALAVEGFFSGFSMQAATVEEMVRWQVARLVAMSFLPGTWLLFSLSYARRDPGEFLTRSWPVVGAAIVLPVGLAVGFPANLIASAGQVRVDDDLRWVFRLGACGIIEYVFFLVGAVVALMNLERTFRASVGTMRWRIKFMVLGLGMLFVVRAYLASQVLLFRGMDLSRDYAAGALLLACPLILRSLLRTGQFEADVYLSHSFLYNSLTLLLSGVYLLVVGALAKVVTYLGKTEAFPLKAFLVLLSLVLLAVLLLSDRVRLHTKRFISRHLRKPHHDYGKIWLEFTKGTGCCVDQAELCRKTVRLVADILHALSVSIWMVDDHKESLVFAASTSLSESRGDELRLSKADAAEVICALQAHPEPVEIDSCKANWAVRLRTCHPDEFRKGSGRICVPLGAGNELLGVMILGDRVSGIDFSIEDLDLLRCIGDQAAANLRNLQLSRKLLLAKELEAFQAMSAFFVHDLKNTASTLNLMLENLPRHFDDPAFRGDALRAISRSVTHINGLIQRLGQLRQTLKIQPEDSDLNDLISGILSTWKDVKNVVFQNELRPVPKVSMDREQIGKVVTNLVINAIEAGQPGAPVSIETSQRNGWVVLSVADKGCGMSPEFIQRSLFRPFQSSKKGGLGIGMFQSRMIVEAHGGKIEVESELGRGTSFRVLLPYPV
jgi:putative PEP-CTERM system histidine kinase